MNRSVITAVGIDVSKGKSMVAVRRPGGEIVLMPFQVQHNVGDLKSLAATLKRIGGDIRIVMEHTLLAYTIRYFTGVLSHIYGRTASRCSF